MAINNVVLTGRLSRDPEIKQTQSGVSVCNFCIAVDRQYKSGEEKICDFINCVAQRGTADFVSKWFHKGDGIGVTGSIQTRKWVTDGGENRYATEVLCQQVSFLDGKKNAVEATQTPAEAAKNYAEIENISEDLPFQELTPAPPG